MKPNCFLFPDHSDNITAMQRFAIIISYDGSAYAGWQIQPNMETMQKKIEEALGELTGKKVMIHGSSRTDQGVHAKHQVAHFDLQEKINSDSLKTGLNALLPEDIRILKAQTVASDFHARQNAVGKEYRYFIWNSDVVPPFLRKYRTHIRKPLNIKSMRKAASYLVGRHDFSAFAANPNRKLGSSIRNLLELRIVKHGSEIVIIAKSSGFLYKMVRSLAGFLIRVGEGAIPASEVKTILSSKIRTARVPTAPPEGLFLWNVIY